MDPIIAGIEDKLSTWSFLPKDTAFRVEHSGFFFFFLFLSFFGSFSFGGGDSSVYLFEIESWIHTIDPTT